MNKLLFLILSIFFLSFLNVNSASAQFCPPENACLCDPYTSYPACCEVEGPGGYNCGGSGETPPPSGGGGGSCEWSQVNCPSGWTRGGSVQSMACGTTNCPAVGTAQLSTGCCGSGFTDENGEFVCANQQVTTYNCCPPGSPWACNPVAQNSAQYTIGGSSCEDEYDTNLGTVLSSAVGVPPIIRICNEEFCIWDYHRYDYYYTTTCLDTFDVVCGCTPTCSATAPSAISYADDLLTWTVGNNGTSQYLYISTSQSDITNQCGSGTDCTINANLTGSQGSYPLTDLLQPETTYFVGIRNYTDSSCSATSTYSFVTPESNDPWWQVRDGDVTTNGILSSSVPDLNVFSDTGNGGSHGVPVYGASFNLYLDTPERISASLWNAHTTTIQTRIFNYDYFANLIPEDIEFNDINDLATGGANFDSNGYEWYKVLGNLDILSDLNLNNRRIVLFVEQGNLNIAGKINLTDGVGFFGAFVNGNITIDPAVTGTPSIEGIYMADNNVSTGSGDDQLHLRGSLAVYGSTLLQRELTDNSDPAELFEFAPDQMLLFPEQLKFKRSKWAEVAP